MSPKALEGVVNLSKKSLFSESYKHPLISFFLRAIFKSLKFRKQFHVVNSVMELKLRIENTKNEKEWKNEPALMFLGHHDFLTLNNRNQLSYIQEREN